MVELANWILSFQYPQFRPTITAILKTMFAGSQTFLDYVVGEIVRVYLKNTKGNKEAGYSN